MRAELIQPLAPDALLFDQAGEAEHPKMLGYGGAALGEVARESIHRGRSRPETIEDRSTRRICNRLEDVGVCSRS